MWRDEWKEKITKRKGRKEKTKGRQIEEISMIRKRKGKLREKR